MLQYYANLGVRMNDDVLLEQAGVTIDDHVNRRCRITVTNAFPETGPEVDARVRLGEVVKLSVHICKGHRREDIGPPIIEVKGPIVACRIEQESPSHCAQIIFTVEQARIAPDEG
jgi:hypothetical protein